MSEVVPEALDHAMSQGDTAAVIAALRDIPQENRPGLAKALRATLRVLAKQDDPHLPWEMKQPLRDRERATQAALFVCGTAKDVADHRIRIEDAAPLAREFAPPCLEGLGDALMSGPWPSLPYINPFIEHGLMQRPDSDAHTLLMMDLPTYAIYQKKASLEAYVAADPTLHPVILRVMEIEGTSDASLAAIDKYRQDAWLGFFHSPWSQAQFGRDVLLDKALDALAQDWPQFRSGWFSRFHERMAPTLDELHARLPRYLALCRSRIPPTVGMALKVIDAVDANHPLATTDLLDALAPAMHAAAKGHALLAMKMIERRLRSEPHAANAAARLLADALGHSDAAVQAKAIKLLGNLALDDSLRDTLNDYLAAVAASNRVALAALAGARPETPHATLDVSLSTPLLPGPCDPSREVPSIDDVDTLAERIAYVFENGTDIDAFEAVVTALTRMAPLDARTRERLAPAAKRLKRLRKPLTQALGQIVAVLLDVTVLPYERQVDAYGEHPGIDIDILDRVMDTVATAQHGAGLEPLDAATHQGGFIDPHRLAMRIAAHAAAGVLPARRAGIRALMRLAPPTGSKPDLRALPDSPLLRAFRYALGDTLDGGELDMPLMVAASRARHPGNDDPILLAALGDLGPDTTRAPVFRWHVDTRTSASGEYVHRRIIVDDGFVPEGADRLLIALHGHQPATFVPRYASQHFNYAGTDEALIRFWATLAPGCLHTFFAAGCRLLGNNLDWSEAQWQNRAYLAPLLEPTVTPGPPGTLLIALALAGKEPGQLALAIDALAQTVLDARIDINALGVDMALLLAGEHVRASRYAKALATAARIAPGMPPVIIRLLEALVAARADDPPRDTALLLSLLHELLLETGMEPGENLRAVLPVLKVTGRSAALRKALLTLRSAAFVAAPVSGPLNFCRRP